MQPDAARVCIALSHFYPTPGGAENQMLELARQWAQWGHAPLVLTRAMRGQPRRQTYEGIEIRRVIRPVDAGPIFGASFIGSLARAFIHFRRRYDVVVTGQVPWEAVASGMVCPMLEKPSAVCIQQTGPFGDLRQIEQARGSKLLRRYVLRNNAFIPLSAQGRREAEQFGCPPEQVHQLTSGVDCEKYHPPATRPADSARTVLFVGRFVPQKNPQVLLHAWKQVNADGAYRLWLAGAGPLESELRTLCAELDLKNVEFLGYCDRMIELYSQASVFCLPSRGEGCPNALLEAMACGVCPVVSDVGGNNDVVTDGVNGRVVPSEDADALASALTAVLSDPATQSRYAEAARAHVVQRHDIRVVAAQYVDIFKQLLAK